MANKQIVFGDRMVNISIQNGLVRMDFAVVAGAAKGKDDQPALKLEAAHQLVMPLDGFAAAVAMQENFVKQLAARQQQQRGAAADEAAVPTETPAA